MISVIEERIQLIEKELIDKKGQDEEKVLVKALQESRNELVAILDRRIKERYKANRMTFFEYGENCGKILAWQIKSKLMSNKVAEIQEDNKRDPYRGNKEIEEAFQDYFEDLYAEKLVTSSGLVRSWLQGVNLIALGDEDEDRNILNKGVNQAEVEEVI
ncbi:hypothetical protein NDU88_005819 [Pleurodeles waltl]|uniref:Phage protein n=1 Tax=Pleurodeles waltl TaxID=8319 RepID=A0AAV7TVV8_PLEWA|nr:hypothetical protein NDU88_005819 [Pleurodeles waltl]